ncbi:MAG: T9SS type A sorting domain-containing protein [Bacteroidales bacterium]|nr:T9SS type A sorting domain-containing protein [Bacteroidales bacterium]
MRKKTFLLAILFALNSLAFSQYQRSWFHDLSHNEISQYNHIASLSYTSEYLYLAVFPAYNGLGSLCAILKYDLNGYLIWKKTFDTYYVGTIKKIKADKYDNLYATFSSGYDYSSFYIKYDKNGNELFKVNFKYYFITQDIQIDENNNIYFYGDDELNSADYICINKFDSLGNEILHKPDSNYTYGYKIIFDKEKNIYAQAENRIIKYSDNGVELWNKATAVYSYLSQLRFDNDSNLIIAGPSRNQDINIMKFQRDGTQLWSVIYNGILNAGDYLTGIDIDKDNNIYVVGETNSVSSPVWTGDFLLLKYDKNGNKLLEKTIKGSSSSGANIGECVICNKDGSIYISGCTYNDLTKADAFIAQIDTLGNILWQDIYNTSINNNEEWNNLYVDNNKNLYVFGISSPSQWGGNAYTLYMKYCSGSCEGAINPSIKGKIFFDDNNNCSLDSAEKGIQKKIVKLTGKNIEYSFSNINGNFSFYTDSGKYTLNLISQKYWNKCSDIIINLNNPTDTSINNFIGTYMLPDIQDLNISIGSGRLRSGDTVALSILLSNRGTKLTDGRVVLLYDGLLKLIGSNPLYDTISSNKVVWNFTKLEIGEFKRYDFYMYVDTNLIGGTKLQNMFAIAEPLKNDTTPLDNIDSLISEVVGPYDPNCKSVLPDTIIRPNDSTLTFLIQFQNIGSDTAFNVVIRDTISEWLDINSIRFGACSFEPTINIINNIVFMKFINIKLPPKSINDKGSNGFIKYTINIKGNLPKGTDITNTAFIYFDYNASISTNTTHSIFRSVGIKEISNKENNMDFIVYPNPANTKITIELPQITKQNTITIYNISGAELIKQQVTKSRTEIDVRDLPCGIYFVKVVNENGVSVGRFLKE